MASDTKRVLHNSTNPSFCAIDTSPGIEVHDEQCDVGTPAHELECEDEGSLSLLVRKQVPTPAPLRSILEFLAHAELHTIMWQTDREVVDLIYMC